ncbi:MAG: hypothetical protein Q9170_001029 [Blastenia crenularia]
MLFSGLSSILAIVLTQFVRIAAGDSFRRMTCWCKNETQIGWLNYYKYHNDILDRSFAIQEECVDFVKHGECLDYHTQETVVCQDYPTKAPLFDNIATNTFCYHHRGHEFFTKGNEADVVHFNKHKHNIGIEQLTADISKEAVDEACGMVCLDKFGLPMLEPYDPGHGVIESRAQDWRGFWYLNVCDGCGGWGNTIYQPGGGIPNDKGGNDHDITGHYSPRGYYDTTGYDGKGLLDRLPHIDR